MDFALNMMILMQTAQVTDKEGQLLASGADTRSNSVRFTTTTEKPKGFLAGTGWTSCWN